MTHVRGLLMICAIRTDASRAGVSLLEARRVVISERREGILFVLDRKQRQILKHDIAGKDGCDVTVIEGR